MIKEMKDEAKKAVIELLEVANLKEKDLFVIGCSSSEVGGHQIGSFSSTEIADALFEVLYKELKEKNIYLAVQCCEHLNRALVVEKDCQMRYNLEQVSAYPIARAGGSMAACAMQKFSQPILVENIQADAGIDIGQTLIGMHLRKVAVPIRLTTTKIGAALITCAYARPKLIGGQRAVYSPQ